MEYRKECETCHALFSTEIFNKKVCSNECRKRKAVLAYGRGRLNKDLPSGTVGAISEMILATDLMLKGYAVFRALSPSCFCDLVAYKNGINFKVECRTGYINQLSGNIVFPKTEKDIDIYGVYISGNNSIHYFEKDSKTPFQA